MPKFWIGCPVKKTRGELGVGVTGRIHALEASDAAPPQCTAQVRIDVSVHVNPIVGRGSSIIPAGKVADVVLDQWDPIIPDGMKPVDQSKLLCNPDGSFNDEGVLTPHLEEVEHA